MDRSDHPQPPGFARCEVTWEYRTGPPDGRQALWIGIHGPWIWGEHQCISRVARHAVHFCDCGAIAPRELANPDGAGEFLAATRLAVEIERYRHWRTRAERAEVALDAVTAERDRARAYAVTLERRAEWATLVEPSGGTVFTVRPGYQYSVTRNSDGGMEVAETRIVEPPLPANPDAS